MSENKRNCRRQNHQKIMKENDLGKIYQTIHECQKCEKVDKYKVCRKIDKTNPNSDVFVVLQALAEHTLRKSGINFYYENGELSSTGKNLEKFLSKINRTIIPDNYNTVYSTDIVQCFPGKAPSKGTDRKPSKHEVENCVSFLKSELEVVNPKLVILVGGVSTESFRRYVMNAETKNFSECVGKIERYNDMYVTSIYHPSGLSRGFYPMLKNNDMINKINLIIN